ncbi:MAG: SGNH/GDSL hydrolase family protein, partial [Vagococcus fluvialis]
SFDFEYYMNSNSYSNLDYFFLYLGINDLFNPENDEQMLTVIQNTINHYNTMITSVHAFDDKIKVIIGLTIPPAYSQDPFGKAYYSTQTRARYKRNHDYFVASLIKEYDKREAEHIILNPIHINLDTRYNMGVEEVRVNKRNSITINSIIKNGGVHPVESGYWQIADIDYAILKGT